MGQRISSFVVDCGLLPGEGKRRYFNTLSRQFISVPGSLDSVLSGAGTGGKLADLLKKGLWVTQSDYAGELQAALRRITTAGINSPVLNVIFTMTTRCNLSCGYCFQNNAERRDADRRTLAAMPNFVAGVLRLRPAARKVRLLLFGGEPLLMQPQCLDILRCVGKLCGARALEFEGGIITNGLGAAPGFWERAAELGLKSAQITIDGAEKEHDAFRRLGANGTYRPLLVEFSRLSRELKVTLKYNLTGNSAVCFREFISDLGAAGFDKKNTLLVLEAVKTVDYNAARPEYFKSTSEATADAYISCTGIALKAGWNVSLSHVFQPPCMYTQERPSTILVCPDGRVSRCISVYTGDLDFYGGNVRDGLPAAGHSVAEEVEGNAANCIKARCPYLPVCLTGCPSFKKMTMKTVKTSFCRRAYFERVVSGLSGLKTDFGEDYRKLEF